MKLVQDMKFIQVVIPLTIGILIYFLFREVPIIDNYRFFPIIKGSEATWVSTNLPDALWLYSLNSAIVCIWNHNEKISIIVWLNISLFFSIFMEFLQLINFIDGTFDFNDIFFYILSSIIFFQLNISFSDKYLRK
jgi:hypothetical protein